MADERGSSAATVLLAFLGGAALGAVAALLLAPQSGRETREQLRGYARRAEDKSAGSAGRSRRTVRRSRRVKVKNLLRRRNRSCARRSMPVVRR